MTDSVGRAIARAPQPMRPSVATKRSGRERGPLRVQADRFVIA